MTPPTELIDRRYSDEKAAAVPWIDAEARLAAAEVAWVVTYGPKAVFEVTPGKARGHAKGRPVRPDQLPLLTQGNDRTQERAL